MARPVDELFNALNKIADDFCNQQISFEQVETLCNEIWDEACEDLGTYLALSTKVMSQYHSTTCTATLTGT